MNPRMNPEPVAPWSHVCADCGAKVTPLKGPSRGYTGIEIMLWVLFLLPGVLYSIWRRLGRNEACPKCGSLAVVYAETPRGRVLLENHHGIPRGERLA